MGQWVGGADTSSRLPGCIFHLVGTHPKQQNPSRIQAQRVATWSAEPVPFSTFEPAKSKGGWVGLEALAGIGWVDVTALGSIVGHQPLQRHVTAASPACIFHLVGTHPKQQNPSRIQAQRVATWSAEPVPFSTFEPAKSKGGWVGLEALAGIGWVDVTALGSIVGHQPLQRHVTAASPACIFHLVGTHPKQQNPSRIQAQRVATWSAEPVPFSTFEPAKSKGGWVGLEALAGIGWVDVTALGSIVAHQPLQRHVTAASPACIFHLVGTHPKQQNPSRIQAQRVATWSAEPVPFSTFEPAKSKGGWVGLEALAGIGWVDVTALGSIVGHQPASLGSTRAKRQHARGGGR